MWGAIELAYFLIMAAERRTASLQFSQIYTCVSTFITALLMSRGTEGKTLIRVRLVWVCKCGNVRPKLSAASSSVDSLQLVHQVLCNHRHVCVQTSFSDWSHRCQRSAERQSSWDYGSSAEVSFSRSGCAHHPCWGSPLLLFLGGCRPAEPDWPSSHSPAQALNITILPLTHLHMPPLLTLNPFQQRWQTPGLEGVFCRKEASMES